MLFARLDAEVAQAQQRLRDIALNIDPAHPKAEALVQRETEYHSLNAKIDRLNLAQMGLVFGRIDIEGEGDNPIGPGMDRRYIGRMGLDDRDDHYRTLLLDWRAPMARPFYLATTAHPEGVHLRRHIRTKGREVVAVDDERLHGEAGGADGASEANRAQETRDGVAGEAALLHAMQRARTGKMRNIVETIQREQDRIIRDDTRGVLVVEGGPGTGKTAVALHRVAYLLYTWREHLARTGVLIVGPNRAFLDYISHVLPELGETGVVLSTVSELYPGVIPTRTEDALSQEIKGSEEMAVILAEAIKDHQRLPESTVELRIDSLLLDVTPAMVKKSRTRARRSRRPHNEARAIFREHLIEQLAQQMAQRIGADPLGGSNLLSRADVDQLHDDLTEEPGVARLIDEFWPVLTPEGVLGGLLDSAETIARVARDYDEETRAALLRAEPGWAPSDAALLDELAHRLGQAPVESTDEAQQQRIEEAQEALDILQGSAVTDNDEVFEAEYLGAYDVIDAETLASRQEERDVRTTAQRAAADRQWAFGHVIVDEAQELTPMEWRMVFRRCPSRWMTLVGDIAQTGSPAGVDSWAETLEPFVGGRFRHHGLSVNYRTPVEIMEVAARVLRRIAPEATPATAIRESGFPVRHTAEVPERPEDGRSWVVITPENVSESKGLEYDHVVVVNPQAIVDASPQGWQNLYVAITRATQTLTIVGEDPTV
ncbi:MULTISPECIES: HelD family protein [unclassified Corynebacterium]|uniref:HelD family protein n=1 Tax=unclassified Corynebacterium TaxID=2624378 RepID=UPI0029C9EB04|nr:MULTISPECIES: UvrD-helicase domain-containing protein [unclassified Corynebacterium]WPF67263.1 AAA family ATPase [Corynebacterium sp. 22KM0430]WPF69753.1 AAA family ATPase [Corynebacterium sp. 21KM1197]